MFFPIRDRCCRNSRKSVGVVVVLCRKYTEIWAHTLLEYSSTFHLSHIHFHFLFDSNVFYVLHSRMFAYIMDSPYLMRFSIPSASSFAPLSLLSVVFSAFQFSSTNNNNRKNISFCSPIPTVSSPFPSCKHSYNLCSAQMLYFRSSFTFCGGIFFLLCVSHSIFHFTFHSTPPVLIIYFKFENIPCFFAIPPFTLRVHLCPCLVFVSDFISFCFHYIEFLFLVCFAFLSSLDCNQVAQRSHWLNFRV